MALFRRKPIDRNIAANGEFTSTSYGCRLIVQVVNGTLERYRWRRTEITRPADASIRWEFVATDVAGNRKSEEEVPFAKGAYGTIAELYPAAPSPSTVELAFEIRSKLLLTEAEVRGQIVLQSFSTAEQFAINFVAWPTVLTRAER